MTWTPKVRRRRITPAEQRRMEVQRELDRIRHDEREFLLKQVIAAAVRYAAEERRDDGFSRARQSQAYTALRQAMAAYYTGERRESRDSEIAAAERAVDARRSSEAGDGVEHSSEQ